MWLGLLWYDRAALKVHGRFHGGSLVVSIGGSGWACTVVG